MEKQDCTHLKLFQFKNNIKICVKCSCLFTKKYSFRKPYSFNTPYETASKSVLLDPKNIFEKKQNRKFDNRYLKIRKELLEFLESKSNSYGYSQSTFYNSISLLDKIYEINYLDNHYLYAISCLLISAKFHEKDFIVPDLTVFGENSGNSDFSIEMIKKCEIECLKYLDYSIVDENSFEYLNQILNFGIIYDSDFLKNSRKTISTSLQEVKLLKNKDFPLKCSEKPLRKFDDLTLERIYNVAYLILKKAFYTNQSLQINKFNLALFCVVLTREVFFLEPLPLIMREIYSFKFEKDDITYEFLKYLIASDFPQIINKKNFICPSEKKKISVFNDYSKFNCQREKERIKIHKYCVSDIKGKNKEKENLKKSREISQTRNLKKSLVVDLNHEIKILSFRQGIQDNIKDLKKFQNLKTNLKQNTKERNMSFFRLNSLRKDWNNEKIMKNKILEINRNEKENKLKSSNNFDVSKFETRRTKSLEKPRESSSINSDYNKINSKNFKINLLNNLSLSTHLSTNRTESQIMTQQNITSTISKNSSKDTSKVKRRDQSTKKHLLINSQGSIKINSNIEMYKKDSLIENNNSSQIKSLNKPKLLLKNESSSLAKNLLIYKSLSYITSNSRNDKKILLNNYKK